MSLDTFFEKINTILEQPKFSDCISPVYRGHSKKHYELIPTLIREYNKTGQKIEVLENSLYCDFRSLVGPKITFNNSWQILFAMRHEGIPTRLLDWTENLGTALFFALNSENMEEPHIWILNPFKLNELSPDQKIRKGLINPEEDLDEYHSTYASVYNNSTIKVNETPFALYPNRTNDRMFAQRGIFTIHGSDERKMEILCSDCIEKIEIPVDIIEKLKSLLLNFGINRYSVYPDLKGLADYLKEYYRY